MLHVLCITTALRIGGVQMFLMNHLAPLRRNGVQLHFAVGTDTPQHFDPKALAEGASIFPVTPYNTNRRQWMADIRQILREHPEMEIVHSHMNYANFLALLAVAGMGRKTIAHSHSAYKATTLANRLIKSTMRLTWPLVADAWWGCTFAALQWMVGKRLAGSKHAAMIPNAISTERFAFNPALRNATRQELGYGSENYVFIHTGSFTPVKNHKFLLPLFAGYSKQHPEARLILCGDGPLRPDIEKQIADLGIEPLVTLTGNTDRTEAYLNAADHMLFPSIFEGFSISLIEAQCNGLTTTTTTTAVPPDAKLRLTESLPDYNIARWIETINKQRQIPNNRAEGRTSVETAGFSAEANAPRLAALYRSLLNH